MYQFVVKHLDACDSESVSRWATDFPQMINCFENLSGKGGKLKWEIVRISWALNE